MTDNEFLNRYEIDPAVSEIEARLKGKSDCPMCGVDSWVIEWRSVPDGTLGSTSTPVFLMKDPRGHFGEAPSVPAVAFTCTNCGFLRLHNWSWIMSQLDRDGDK